MLNDRLNIYIFDYLQKRKFHQSAHFFAQEARVYLGERPPIDINATLLYQWWSLFKNVLPENSSIDFTAGPTMKCVLFNNLIALNC
jgi:hypothetical protein